MPQFRKKPVEIEARQLPTLIHHSDDVTEEAIFEDVREADGAVVREIADWCGGEIVNPYPVDKGDGKLTYRNHLLIPTLEGDMRAEPGDWIIKGVKGEFYPCKPDIFEATYDEVLDQNIDMIDIKEFVEVGYLQEANRLFFHPLGLALAVNSPTGEDSLDQAWSLSSIWDSRLDYEGFLFGYAQGNWDIESARAKAKNVRDEFDRHLRSRIELGCDQLGIEPIEGPAS